MLLCFALLARVQSPVAVRFEVTGTPDVRAAVSAKAAVTLKDGSTFGARLLPLGFHQQACRLQRGFSESQSTEFTPDVPGSYQVTVTNQTQGSPVTLTGGLWRGEPTTSVNIARASRTAKA